MAESNIDIILKTKREGAQAPQQAVEDLKKMKTGLSDVEKAMLGSRTTIGGLDKDVKVFGKNVGSATDLLGGMGMAIPISPLMLFGQALQAGGKFVSDSLDDYTAYVEQVDRISTYTGMASEDTSKLIQVADDLRIEVGTVQMALKTMTDNGTVPSIQGLMELSDRFVAIQDPQERAIFLNDNFGRSGVEMARLMELGGAAIRGLTDDVSQYMIITGKSKEEAEAFLKSQDNLRDQWAGVKYQLSESVIPPLTDVLNLVSDSNDAVEGAGGKWMNWIPILGQARRGFLTTKEYLDSTTKTVQAQTEEVAKLGDAWKGAAEDAQYYGNTSRGNINNRPNVHNPGDEGYNPSGQFGSGRAGGGDVWPGGIYKVGERETEFLTVGMPGMVSPMGGGQPINLYFTYAPAISLGDRNEAEQTILPLIKAGLRQIKQ